MAAGLTNGSGCSPLTVLVGGEPIDEKLWNLLVADKANVFYNLYTFSALSKLFDLISCYTRSKSSQHKFETFLLPSFTSGTSFA
jgi:hypothetical protein